MSKKIELDKPENLENKLEEIKNKAFEKGIVFKGDIKFGEFEGKGVKGIYEINDKIYITVLKKPFYVSIKYIKNELANFFKS